MEKVETFSTPPPPRGAAHVFQRVSSASFGAPTSTRNPLAPLLIIVMFDNEKRKENKQSKSKNKTKTKGRELTRRKCSWCYLVNKKGKSCCRRAAGSRPVPYPGKKKRGEKEKKSRNKEREQEKSRSHAQTKVRP